MPQVKVQAVTGFEHNGTRSRGDTFVVSDQHAHALQARGLVKIVSATDETEQAKAAAEAARKVAASAQTTSRKRQSAQPKESKTEKPEGDKAAAETEALSTDSASTSDATQSEGDQHQAQSATEDVAAAPAASDAKTE